MNRDVLNPPQMLLDLKQQFEKIQSRVNEGPGSNKKAFSRVLSIRRTLYVAAATEEECRCISSMVRLLRKWFSDKRPETAEVEPARRTVLAAVANVARIMSQSADSFR